MAKISATAQSQALAQTTKISFLRRRERMLKIATIEEAKFSK